MEISHDPQILQTHRRSRLPHRRGFQAFGAGEVHPAWASQHPASVVGAAALGSYRSMLANKRRHGESES